MALRAISFDLFDTLVDLRLAALPEFEHGGRTLRGSQPLLYAEAAQHAELAFAGFVRALGELDRELRGERLERGLEVPTLERFTELCRRLAIGEPDLPARLTEIHMACIRQQVVAHDHHRDVLAALRGRAKLAVCSNFSHAPTARRVLADAGLLEHFAAVVISEDVGIRKPRPEIFQALLEQLDVRPAQLLHIGDQLAQDVSGAAPLGIGTVWLTRCVPDPAAARAGHGGPDPDHVIADLAEISALAEALGA